MKTIEVSDEEYEAFMAYTAIWRLLGTPMETVIRVDSVGVGSIAGMTANFPTVTVSFGPNFEKTRVLYVSDTLTLRLTPRCEP